MDALNVVRIEPLADKILVERLDEPDRSAGGILIPDSAKKKSIRGRVIAAGPGATDEKGQLVPMNPKITPGAVVVFGQYAGNEARFGDEEYLFLSEEEVLGVMCDE